MIKIIVALGKNRLIGKNNSLPWDIKSDLSHFKKTTLNHPVIMGEKTYESLGRPLPNRENIVLTLIQDYDPHSDKVKVCHDFNAIVSKYEKNEEVLFVIGGAQIYKLFLPYTSELVVSHIKGDYDGNIYFPEFEDFFKVYNIEKHDDFDVYYYRRK
ncbi:MAG: dihydrofolate reductase [Bacilli bacterium]|nr:dihydrofolate reductase [Bacilli bacterium]MCK9309788.1 dihydrofolate reductase [Candidatus Cloacimonadota bacterium]